MRLLRLFLLAGTAGLVLSCSRGYPQNPGAYVMTATEVLRDECGLLRDATSLWDGSMQITGEVVRMDYELADMQLIGAFLGGTDEFAMDGSVANATVRLNGQDCLLDQINVHMEGRTRCATEFDGVVRVRYEARRPDSCVCELWTRFTAVQDSASCETSP